MSVQLSVFERGSAVIDQGAIARGMYVAIDKTSRPPQLELAFDDDDEVFFAPEPNEAKRRAWPWAVAGLACALATSAGWYYVSQRPQPTSETTITEARLPIAEIATTSAPPPPRQQVTQQVTAPPPPPQKIIAAPPPPPRVETVAPQQRLRALPPAQKPRQHTQPHPQPSPSAAAGYDPLTI
jgi:hypothetical protein